MDINIRGFRNDNVQPTARIFFDAIRLGTAGYYDERQRKAWADKVPDTDEWRQRLQRQYSFVAEVNAKPVGFMTLDAGGHIDLAFVAPDWIGKGVGRALYERIEAEARGLGIPRLDTEASYLARPFFKRQGWLVVRQQSVELGSVSLTNFVMEKRLGKT